MQAPASGLVVETGGLACRASLLVAFVTLTACASMPAAETKPDPVSEAVEQPFRDLNVVRRTSPPSVAKAALAPYAPAAGESCEQLALDIAALSKELGPDFDAPQAQKSAADDLLGDAVGSVLNLPFRGVLRTVTGAAEHDRLLALAVTAGIARRAFLRGVASERGCDKTKAEPAP